MVQVACNGVANYKYFTGADYAELPYATKVKILKMKGIGSCKIKVLPGGGFEFFYSDKIPGGTHLNQWNVHVIDESLKNGDCNI